jgi:hypothetical protein
MPKESATADIAAHCPRATCNIPDLPEVLVNAALVSASGSEPRFKAAGGTPGRKDC